MPVNLYTVSFIYAYAIPGPASGYEDTPGNLELRRVYIVLVRLFRLAQRDTDSRALHVQVLYNHVYTQIDRLSTVHVRYTII